MELKVEFYPKGPNIKSRHGNYFSESTFKELKNIMNKIITKAEGKVYLNYINHDDKTILPYDAIINTFDFDKMRAIIQIENYELIDSTKKYKITPILKEVNTISDGKITGFNFFGFNLQIDGDKENETIEENHGLLNQGDKWKCSKCGNTWCAVGGPNICKTCNEVEELGKDKNLYLVTYTVNRNTFLEHIGQTQEEQMYIIAEDFKNVEEKFKSCEKDYIKIKSIEFVSKNVCY